jgi:hypothetical protein
MAVGGVGEDRGKVGGEEDMGRVIVGDLGACFLGGRVAGRSSLSELETSSTTVSFRFLLGTLLVVSMSSMSSSSLSETVNGVGFAAGFFVTGALALLSFAAAAAVELSPSSVRAILDGRNGLKGGALRLLAG